MPAARALTLTILVGVSLSLAGCGGSGPSRKAAGAGSSPSGATTETATAPNTGAGKGRAHATLVAAMNAICASTNHRLNGIHERDAGSPHEVVVVLSKGLPIYRSAISRLASLHPGTADRPAFARYERAVREDYATLVRTLADLRHNEAEEVASLESLASTYVNERTAAANELGAEVCGGG